MVSGSASGTASMVTAAAALHHTPTPECCNLDWQRANAEFGAAITATVAAAEAALAAEREPGPAALRTYPGTSVPIFIFILGWSFMLA